MSVSAMIGEVRGRTWHVLGGVAAIAGGLAWMIKASWILAGRPQPELVFEIAPFFLAVTTTCLGMTADGLTPRRRASALALGGLGMIAGLLAAITELVDTASEPALAVSTIAGSYPSDPAGPPRRFATRGIFPSAHRPDHRSA